MAIVAGLVLAAGRGTRFGGPKVLAGGDNSWLTRVTMTLDECGLSAVVAIPEGFSANLPRTPPGTRLTEVPEPSEGLSDSLRAGLAALEGVDVVLITTVDLPDLPAAAVRRLLSEPLNSSTLRRAVFSGRPGHPVVVGRDHWPALLSTLSGDTGAGPYLSQSGAEEIDCSDLFPGDDIDTP